MPNEKCAAIEMVARAPKITPTKKLKAAVSAPVDDNQLIISSRSENDAKNGLGIKNEEQKLAEVKA